MEPIRGTASIKLDPVTIAPASPPHTYFGVAESMMSGVNALAAASPPSLLALALVAAHVLECLLKAYLSRNGSDAPLKKQLSATISMPCGPWLSRRVSKSSRHHPPGWNAY